MEADATTSTDASGFRQGSGVCRAAGQPAGTDELTGDATAQAGDPVVPRPRLLFITPASPFETASGSEQRSHLLWRAMKRLGDVDVVMIEPGPAVSVARADREGTRAVKARAPEASGWRRFRCDADLCHEIERAFGTRLADYAVVVGRYMWASTRICSTMGVPIVADLDDFSYRYGPGSSRSLGVLKERLRKKLSHWLATRSLGRFDAAFFASRRDQRENPGIRSAVLPNVPLSIPATCEQDAPDGNVLLFVGSLWYRPNREGIDWFLRHVWPRILEARPTTALCLVGAAPPAVRAQWECHPNVTAVGFVDDLGAAYRSCSAVIAPIHSGGGTNIKIVEALAHQRACVTTTFCFEAFADTLVAGKDILVAGEETEFAMACLGLFEDTQRRQQIAAAGRKKVASGYSAANFASAAVGFLDAVTHERRRV